jgi:hypothetical protein
MLACQKESKVKGRHTIAPDVNALASESSRMTMFTHGKRIGVTHEVKPRR